MSLKKKKEEEFSIADSIINGTFDETFNNPSYNVQTGKSVANTVDTFNNVSNNIKNKTTTMSFDDDKKEESSVAESIIKGINPLADKTAFVGKSAGAGLLSGLTGIADAPLQNIQEGAQKGKKKSKSENYVKGLLKTLDIYGITNLPEMARESSEIIQDNSKSGWQKALNIGGAILNNNPLVNNLEAAGQQLNIFDKDAEKDIANVRKKIETPSNKLNENVAKDSEKMSGGWKTAGEVSQTIGNMIPSMALTAVTKNPDIGLAAMGVSAKGQATKEAEERGADLNTANEIGLGKGLVEVGTEKLTGGLKFFGKGTADDLVEKGINKAIKNKAGNFIAKQAAGMAGEVGEETISDLVDTAIDKATVDPDASYSFDDWKKTALMTMLSTGALNTISGGYSKQAYQLNAEELNDIAQSKKVQDTVNERVEQFKTPDMTPEQVEQLREQTTAVVLGEIQQNVDDILDSSIAQLQEQSQIPTQTPINTLSSNIQEQNNQTPYQAPTPEITPFNEVNQELQETRQQDVADSVRAMNLEQEPQFTQKQGNYVYEKSDNSKIDNLRKDAANYLKEGEQTTNFVNTLEKIIEDKNIEIRFDPNLRDSQGRMANGSYSDGVITLNPNSNRAGEFLTIHELTHAIGTKSMIKMIEKYRKSNAEFDSAVQKLLTTYKTTEINEEALADISGQLFGNQEYINSLSMENPSLFKRIYNNIKYMWHKLRGYKNQSEFVEDLYNKWESAYRNQKIQQKAKNSNIEMSTQTDSNGSKLSNEQVDYFKDSKVRDENGNLIPVYHGTNYDFTIFKNPSRKFNEYASGKMFENTSISMFTDSQEVAQTYIDNEENQNKKPMKEYLNITNPYIIDAKYQNNKFFYDENGNPTNVNELVKKIYDSGKYDGVIIKNIADLGNYEDYDVTDGRQYATDYIVFNSNQIKNIDNLTPTQDDDIRYSKEEISNKDSQGKELSKQQQEYFKDSKVRDENGNLIIMNHATPDASFTVFKDAKQGKNSSKYYNQKGELGRGFYFSDLKSSYNIWNDWVERETQKPAQSMKVYLDIKNPFYVTNNKINQDVKKYLKEKGFIASRITSNAKALNSAKFGNIDIQDMLKTLGYDGIIDGDKNTIYQAVTFNSNQIKNVDNTNPTEDPDIRYSKDNQTWREYLEKEFPSQGTRTNLQDINERNKPKKVEDTTKQEKPQETPKKEVKKSFLNSAEQNELESLRDLDNRGLLEETDADYKRLQELEKKSQGITKKFPELKKTVTQEDTKPLYFKYKDNEISRENNKILNEAKNIVEANKQGRRTKEQWLQVAEYIGSNADIKNSTDLQKLAMETWLASRPNTKDNLNRQGKKYVDFKTNEWFNAMYKGAGVGTDVKLSQEERNTINESKQDEVAVLRTPTEIQPKEVKTPEQKQEYFEESGTPKKVAKILSETPRETETSTLREKYQTLKRAVVDKGEAIYRIAKQTKNRRLYAMYDRIGLATGEGNSDIGISQTNLDGESYKNFTDSKGNKTSMSLNDIWKDVEDSNIPENVMNEYLANYLNVDRYKANQLSIEEIEELKELNKYKNLSKTQKERVEELNTLAETRNVFGKDITREDSLNKIKEIEEKYPQIKRPAENIWQYGKNQLQKMVDAGLVSKESQEYYNENTPHYVRLQRSTESKKGSVFDSRGHLQVNNQIKKAKGGTKDIIPFKDSMAQYTLDTTSSIRKNLFGQELSKTLKNGLETDGNVDIDNIDNNILNANEDGSYTFKIFKDGKPEILTIDKGIYEALQPNKHYELEKLFTPFKTISNFKRTVLTDKNPLFLATNFFKDFFDAPLNTKHSTVDFVKNYGVAINQILKNGEYYQKYQALGGNQNTYFDKEGFSKPSKISKIIAPIEKANEFIEMLPRMSEFITSLKKGESLDEAMYNAAEITTNFKRGGTATKIVNRNGATFLNASVQGFDKQIRNFTEIENPKQAARLLTKTLVLGVAPALLNAVMYDDDDEYEDLPDYVKDSYYLFKTGKDNKWIRIPKGRAISVIQAAARRTYNYSKGDKDAYKGLAGHFENQLAPNNPLESNVLSPLVDVKNNKAWSGNKIVSDSIANASHPEEEYDAKTDELSKWLGKKLGKSPKKINYIIDQNTGAIGDLLLPFLTKQAEGEDDSVAGRLLKNPVKDKFSTDAVLNSKQVNQFYDAFNKAEDDKKWSKATDEDKLKYKYLYSTMLELAEKNKQIKEIESSDKSDKEKYRETKAIKQEMNDMSKKAVKESENIKINDYYAQIDDKVYKKEYDKSTGEYKYTKVQQKQLDKIKDKGVPLSDYFQEAYEKQKKRATK